MPPFNSNLAVALGETPSPREVGAKAIARNVAFARPTRDVVAPPREVSAPAPAPKPTDPSALLRDRPAAALATARDLATEDGFKPFPNATVTEGTSPWTGEKIPVIHVSGANVVDSGGAGGAGAPPPMPAPEPTTPPLVTAPTPPRSPWVALAVIAALLAVLD